MIDSAWIRQRLDEAGATQAALARAIGMTPDKLSKIMSGGRDIKASEAAAIAEFFEKNRAIRSNELPEQHTGNSPEQLPAYSGNLSSGVVTLGGQEFVTVARWDARMSAGPGAMLDAHAEPLGYAVFERQWLAAVTRAAPASLALLQVDGDSMEPTLYDRDWVLVDRSQTRLDREGVYAIAIGEHIWVKRISLNFRERLIKIISDNTRYPVEQAEEEDLNVIGRIVWVVGRRV